MALYEIGTTPHAPASITKLMTLFTAKRIIDQMPLLDTVYTVERTMRARRGGRRRGRSDRGRRSDLQDLLCGPPSRAGRTRTRSCPPSTPTANNSYYMNEIAKNSGWSMSFTDPSVSTIPRST